MSQSPDIMSFSGKYSFLSNFWESPQHPIWYKTASYKSVEYAYQTAKTLNMEEALWVQSSLTPGVAKRRGNEVTLRPDWEKVKTDIMAVLLEEKFNYPDLAEKLIATFPTYLAEGNNWGDRFWGIDIRTGIGQNRLGRILMIRRDVLMEMEKPVVNYDNF